MKLTSQHKVLPVAFATLMLVVAPAFASLQEQKSRVASGNGEGTLKIGREKFKVYSVIAKLIEGGDAEITLISDITIFLSGTWAGSPQNGLDVQITGGATKGGVEGGGKLFLRDEGKSVASLKLQLVNRSLKRNIDVNFVAK